MSISDGQPVNAAASNAAWLSRTVDTDTVGRVDLENALAASGPNVSNTQREINSLNAFTGRPAASAHDATPVWTSNEVGTSTDDLKDRAEALTVKFDEVTGHNHDGTAGGGAPVSAADLADFNNFFTDLNTATFDNASGTTDDVSSVFSLETPGGATAAAGVITTAPDNIVELTTKSTNQEIEDANGQKVYARLTESVGVWTLSYFTNEAGTETAHSLSTQDIRLFYRKVYTAETRPTIPTSFGRIQSLDLTADIVDATSTQRGLVSTGAQSWAGVKTFLSAPILDSLVANAVLFLNASKAIASDATNFFWDFTNFRLGVKTNAPNTTLDVNGDWAVRKTDESSGATQNALDTPTSFIRITGTVTVINGIDDGFNGKRVLIYNQSSNTITINHLSGSASAEDQITLPAGDPMTLDQDQSAEFVYDSTASLWALAGSAGSGSGGGALVVTGTRAAPEDITAAGGIAFTGSDARQLWFIQGDGAHTNVTANPQVAAGSTVGQELVLVGRNSSQTVLLENGTGLSLNGSWEGAEDSVLNLFYDGTNWVETSRR